MKRIYKDIIDDEIINYIDRYIASILYISPYKRAQITKKLWGKQQCIYSILEYMDKHGHDIKSNS